MVQRKKKVGEKLMVKTENKMLKTNKPKNPFLWPNTKVCVLKIMIYKMSDLEILSFSLYLGNATELGKAFK